jgi:hypothetical protein
VTTPGKRWRMLIRTGTRAEPKTLEHRNEGVLDELVVDDWLHLEQMDTRAWWMRVGDYTLDIYIEKDGTAKVLVQKTEDT